jgi:hypothetical protein
VALARAGRTAARGARAAQAGGEITLGLEVGGPLGWATSAAETISSLRGRIAGGLDSGSRTEQAGGSLTAADGSRYETSIEDGKPKGVYCPKQTGIVEATGALRITRSFTVGRVTRTERFLAEYKITGHVDTSAKLKSYDVEVRLSAETGGSSRTTTGRATGIAPRAAGSAAIVPASAISITGPDAAGMRSLAAAAIAFAQRAGLAFVQDAEQRFHDEASCLEAIPQPGSVRRGSTEQVKIRVKSRITGRFVESNLTLTPAGGARVTPTRVRSTPATPGRVSVTMPAARGSSARAAAAPSVGIVGRERTGRSTGTIGSGDRYEVVLDVRGQGVFGAWNAFGDLKVRLYALPQDGGDGRPPTRWEGVGAAVWTGVVLVPTIACTLTNPVGVDTLNVSITALPDERIRVQPYVPNGAALTATLSCAPAPPIPGEPMLSLIGVFTVPFEFPADGGTAPLPSGLAVGSTGFVNTGMLTVTRE